MQLYYEFFVMSSIFKPHCGKIFNMIKDTLKNLRLEKGLTQLEIANILGVSRTGYASWEQGKAEPNIIDIKKICCFFCVSLNELLEFETDEQINDIKNLLNHSKNQP